IPDAPTLNPARQFSIEAWVKPSSAGAYMIILNKEASTFTQIDDIQYEFAVNGSSLAFLIGGVGAGRPGGTPDDGGAWTNGGGVVPLNQWTHVALTIDLDAGLVATYVNGVQARRLNVSTTLSLSRTSGDLRIGNRKLFGGSFAGLIDEVGF